MMRFPADSHGMASACPIAPANTGRQSTVPPPLLFLRLPFGHGCATNAARTMNRTKAIGFAPPPAATSAVAWLPVGSTNRHPINTDFP